MPRADQVESESRGVYKVRVVFPTLELYTECLFVLLKLQISATFGSLLLPELQLSHQYP